MPVQETEQPADVEKPEVAEEAQEAEAPQPVEHDVKPLPDKVEGFDWEDQEADTGLADTVVIEIPKDDDTPADKPKKETTPVEEADDEEEPDFDPELVSTAKDYGLDPADFADSLGLERTISALERRLRPKPAKPAAKQAEEELTPEEEFELNLSEDWDAGLVDNLQGMHKHYSSKVKALNEKVERLEAVANQSVAAAFEQRFDNYVEKLGPEYEDVFGKGRGRDLPQESQEFKNRVQLLEEMDSKAYGYASRGKAVEEGEIFLRSVRSLFGQKAETMARKQLTAKVKKRSAQALNRPTSRRGKAPVSERADAIQFGREFMQERGFDPNNIEEEPGF